MDIKKSRVCHTAICQTVPCCIRYGGKAGREDEHTRTSLEPYYRSIGIEAKLTGAPGPDALKGFHALRGYYGDDAFIKGMVICRVKEEFALAKQVRAVNGIKTDFAL